MKGKVLAVLAAVVVVIGIGTTVGGWVSNEGPDSETEEVTTSAQTEESTEEDQTAAADAETGAASNESVTQASEDAKESGTKSGVVVDTIPFNTDAPLSNLSVTIANHIGNKMIFKVENNSDVCYKYLDIDVYFNSDPLPNRKPTDEEYHNGYNFLNIPAHSVTYHVAHAFWEGMGKQGEEDDGILYYPFDLFSDPYRIVIGEPDPPMSNGYMVSDTLIQNAMDYLEVDQENADLSKNKLATVTNLANRHVEFTGFVILDDRVVEVIQNGSELLDSSYEDIIPACNVTFQQTKDRVYDCNSLYTDPYDMDISNYDLYQVHIGNAWFNDEVEDPGATAGPKPTVGK
ncbi:MAG: hypothetical protein IJ374_08390 [Lachnospiraceae bacterium]|nr:hypothetical protein [Lachnospiraceae bacterium]